MTETTSPVSSSRPESSAVNPPHNLVGWLVASRTTDLTVSGYADAEDGWEKLGIGDRIFSREFGLL